MPITTISQPPLRNAGLTQDAYSAQMESTLNTMKKAVDDINANASQYNVATSTTSTSNVLIGTGAKTFSVPAALGFVVGMTLRIANSSANFMTGEVTSYIGTSLVMNITSVGGSGTLASWSISMAAVGASTAASVSNTPAGNIAATTVQAAINELDTEKLSSSAGAVTDTNLNTITTGATVGDSFNIPAVTYTAKGRVSGATTSPKITSGTLQNTTSGTTIDFTGISPSAKRITLMIAGVSTSGTSPLALQLGISTGVETTGYLGASSGILSNSGFGTQAAGASFVMSDSGAATAVRHGSITISQLSSASNIWVVQGVLGQSDVLRAFYVGGSKTLGGVLDRIRLTTVNGTDTFDAGSVNILVE
jgi:hypothetical protein